MGGLHAPKARVRFGIFEADFRTGEFRRRGAKIKLQKQPLQILEMLLEHPGDIVTREQLRQKIWPADTFVDFEQGLYNAVGRLRDALKDSADKPRYIETLPRRGYRFIGTINTTPPVIRSLAVLVFENLSRDPEQEYFAEGLTEALINTLAKIGDLRVASRTSVMRYKGVHKSLPETARELDVEAIVEGTVLRAGDRVRITAQLIDAGKEAHLWAESYERDLRDVLRLQSEIVDAIAREIRVKVTAVDRARFADKRPVDPEAYEAYLKGRYHWNRQGLRKGIQFFEQAIAKDPTFAAAYAGLADCFSALSGWGHVPSDQGAVKAKELARQALEIDNGLAEAHTALALANMYQFDFLTAGREFERASELDPRYATAHHLFGFYLGAMARYEEAYTEFQRALRLDPLSSIINSMFGFLYIHWRRYDHAIAQLEKTLEIDPTSAPAYGGLGWAYRCKSMHESAIPALRKAFELWQHPTTLAWLGEAYAAGGYQDEATKILAHLSQLSQQRYVTPCAPARVHAAMGNKDEACQWLEAAYLQRAEWMVLLKVDPCFDDLRPDPRFRDLLHRMNFPSS